ncbi:MAG: immunoglobulin domain-containing protein, partial [Verrucomicrobiota bacterium]
MSPGTYNEINIQLTNNITISSVSGPTNTIVDMQHTGRGFIVTGPALTNVSILGLTIQNAQIPYYSGGGAVQVVSGKCRISGCIIQGVSGAADYSGCPVFSDWANTNVNDVVVDNCIVRNNFAANCAGIGNCAVIKCLIYNNSAGNNPIALAGCHSTNCTVYNNTGGFLPNSWTAGGMGGGTAVNCIFWGNSGHNGQQIDPGSSATVTYSIVQGGFTGTGNLNSDPLFVNASIGDFHLQTNSPARHSGDPTILNVDGSRSDMGAYGGNFPEDQQDPTFVWTKLLSSTNMPPLNGDTGWRSLPGSMDENHRIIYSLSENGVFWKYDIGSNLFTQLPVSGAWPGRVDTFIYNPEENSIWFTLYGRGQVFRLPVTGGAFTSVGSSGASYSDFGDITFWNPVTHKFETFNGYGYFAVRNWRWAFGTTDSDWVQIEPNTPGRQPWPRAGGSWTVDNIGQRVFHGGGGGNSTGAQGQVDSGFDFFMGDTRFDALRDLWLLDLKLNKWVNLIPLNTAIRHFGPLVYFRPQNKLLMINGQNTLSGAFETGVWTFAVGQDTNFTQATISGDIPNASDDPGGLSLPYYDSLSQRVIYFNTNGVYALSLISPSPAPSITTQPVSQSVNQGSPVSFSVIATGTSLNFQWRLNSVDISGATNDSYNIASATTNDAGIYNVIVSNLAGSVTSSNAVLTVWSTNNPTPASAQSLPLPQANFELIQSIQDQSSRVWVLGAFTNSVTLGTNTFTSRGQRDVLLMQYSPAGVVNWAATIGGIYDDVYSTGYVPGGVRMSVQSNTCVVAGVEHSSLTVVDGGKVTNTTAYNTGNKVEGSDGFLLTFNSAGQLVWKASVTGTSATDGGQFTAIDNSGNIYWVGSYNGCCPTQGGATVTDGVGGSTSITSPSYGTGFLIKFNSAGAYQWSAKCYNRDATFESGVAVDNAGSVFVVGYSRANSSGTATTLVDAGGNVRSVANGGFQSTFLAKFTSNGIYQWSLSTPGGPDSASYVGYNALIAATNGDVFLAGTYNTVGLTFGGQSPQLPVPNAQDGFVGCINSSGQVKWLTQFGGGGDQVVGSVYHLSNSQVLAAGRTTNGLILANTNLISLGGVDGFVVTLSTNGSPLNATLIGQGNDNDVRNAQGTTSGVTMIAGQTMAGFQAYGITFTNAGAYVGLVNTSSNPPPTITSQPVSQSVNQGSPVSFSVIATGTGLGFQWRLNTVNISGATNDSFNLASATTSDAGIYNVIVSNLGGSVTSSNAVLT